MSQTVVPTGVFPEIETAHVAKRVQAGLLLHSVGIKSGLDKGNSNICLTQETQ